MGPEAKAKALEAAAQVIATEVHSGAANQAHVT